MTPNQEPSLFEHLSKIQDPRIEGTKRHLLTDIPVIAVLATICAAESYPDIEEFGIDKEEWLRTFLELPNGIPSHDTFRRVFILLRMSRFQEVFCSWIKQIAELSAGEIIAIDGKQLKGSKKKQPTTNEGLRMVSAWAEKNRPVLGQVKTAEKSNEITAIPELLGLLSLKGCLVTIDAMGCQKETVERIVEQKADYVISLKGNQGNLHKDVADYFTWALESKVSRTGI